MGCPWLWPCFCFVFGLGFWGCCWRFLVLVLCFVSPSICGVSYPSTMTWAHRPHGVRARGKKECSSLQWVHASEGAANQFCSSTKFGHHLFRDCVNLATFVLQEISHQQDLPARIEARELPQGCPSSTGIAKKKRLTRDFQVLGAHACGNCKLLMKVDISNTKIEEIQEFTFVHCTSLCEIKLPHATHH